VDTLPQINDLLGGRGRRRSAASTVWKLHTKHDDHDCWREKLRVGSTVWVRIRNPNEWTQGNVQWCSEEDVRVLYRRCGIPRVRTLPRTSSEIMRVAGIVDARTPLESVIVDARDSLLLCKGHSLSSVQLVEESAGNSHFARMNSARHTTARSDCFAGLNAQRRARRNHTCPELNAQPKEGQQLGALQSPAVVARAAARPEPVPFDRTQRQLSKAVASPARLAFGDQMLRAAAKDRQCTLGGQMLQAAAKHRQCTFGGQIPRFCDSYVAKAAVKPEQLALSFMLLVCASHGPPGGTVVE